MTSVQDDQALDQRWTLRACAWLILLSALARVGLAAFVTDFVLVDDAYITLRYARMASEVGALVYNAGEPVFGVTSPLWGVVTAGLYALLGSGNIEVGVILLGILFWSLAAWRLARHLPASIRLVTVVVFLWAPVFVDNQFLGMETPMVVWLSVGAMCAALEGRLRAAAAWTGWLLVARPEGVLFAPALLYAASRSGDVRRLAQPRSLALLLAPGLTWVAYALARYGSVVPQSMLAKSGWNSTHYDGLATADMALHALPRLTFLPFVDYLPGARVLALVTLAAVVWVTWINLRRGSTSSRAWLLFYLTYVSFYLVGKGATEASWYAVPSSVALLLAASPAWPTRLVLRPRALAAMGSVLALASCGLAWKRAPLLASYVQGYGACAEALNHREDARPAAENPVLIGEIGVFGFVSDHPVIDVGALVSPQVLPLKNEGRSLLSLARATGARWLVISDIALERNLYPSVGQVWANDEERDWLLACPVVHQALDKKLLRLEHPDRPLAR